MPGGAVIPTLKDVVLVIQGTKSVHFNAEFLDGGEIPDGKPIVAKDADKSLCQSVSAGGKGQNVAGPRAKFGEWTAKSLIPEGRKVVAADAEPTSDAGAGISEGEVHRMTNEARPFRRCLLGHDVDRQALTCAVLDRKDDEAWNAVGRSDSRGVDSPQFVGAAGENGAVRR